MPSVHRRNQSTHPRGLILARAAFSYSRKRPAPPGMYTIMYETNPEHRYHPGRLPMYGILRKRPATTANANGIQEERPVCNRHVVFSNAVLRKQHVQYDPVRESLLHEKSGTSMDDSQSVEPGDGSHNQSQGSAHISKAYENIEKSSRKKGSSSSGAKSSRSFKRFFRKSM